MGKNGNKYVFVGWDADGDGEVDYSDDEAIVVSQSLTLKAVYNIVDLP